MKWLSTTASWDKRYESLIENIVLITIRYIHFHFQVTSVMRQVVFYFNKSLIFFRKLLVMLENFNKLKKLSIIVVFHALNIKNRPNYVKSIFHDVSCYHIRSVHSCISMFKNK